MRRLSTPWRPLAALLLVAVALAGLGRILPSGVPAGVVLLGLALGGLEALTAVGLVLIYRAARIINFSQVAIGGLASAVAVLLVAGWGLPYAAAVFAGLAVAVATGAVIELVVVRRFWSRSRVIFTVATIGVALIVGAAQVALPSLFSDLGPTDRFRFPWSVSIDVGPVVIGADHVVAIIVVPLVLTALWIFLDHTRMGTALRAMADAPDRARLLGIPLQRLSLLTWMLAAALSGIGTMLAVPMVGVSIGATESGQALLVPLVAAVIARMDRILVAAGAAIAIGVLDQVVFWNYPRSSTVDVVLFGIVLVALMLQRRSTGDRSHQAPEFVVRPPSRVPDAARRLPEVQAMYWALWVLAAAAFLLLPQYFDNSQLAFASTLAIYGILALSLSVLTGWAGLISLGQFAFAGLGASATAFLLTEGGVDVLIALPVGMVVAALSAGLVAIPAVRFKPLFFAVTTFALAVPVASWLLNPTNFPALTPSSVRRPVVAGRWDLDSPISFYYFCLAALSLVLVGQWNLRRSRVGRSIIATRDNARVAAAMAISPTGALMTSVLVSGAMAGLAGGIWVIGLRSVPFNAFSPEASIQLFTMVVIGGLGSTLGVLLGAAYVWSVEFYLRGAAQLLATGAGLLVLLMVLPEGLAGAVYGVRDRLIRWILERRSTVDEPRREPLPSVEAENQPTVRVSQPHSDTRVLEIDALVAGYDHMPVLRSVTMSLEAGKVTALVGPNGSGKTTMLRTISGLMDAQSGTIRVEGRELTESSVTERVVSGMATVFGGEDVFGSLSVSDNLRLGNWLGRSEDSELVLQLFPELALRRSSPANTLSGGERQMLTIAQALLTRPNVLLIDELTLGLAPSRVATIKDVLRRLADQGAAILVVEQSAEVISDLADTTIGIERGAIVSPAPHSADLEPAAADLDVRIDGSGSAPVAGPEPGEDDNGAPTSKMQLDGISVHYGGVNALVDVNLTLRDREILGIIGPNGAGKTTLVDTCSGFTAASGGTISLLGKDVTGQSPTSRSSMGLGRVFQQAVMFPTLSVAEVLSVARERFVRARDPLTSALRLPHVAASEESVRFDVARLLEAAGLTANADTPFGDLPLGVRRRVQLWAALAHEPDVLLLDEPTAGLRSGEASELGAFIRELPRSHNISILIIEHDVPLILSVSDRVVAMDRGRVIGMGQPQDVLADPEVQAAYFGVSQPAADRRPTGDQTG